MPESEPWRKNQSEPGWDSRVPEVQRVQRFGSETQPEEAWGQLELRRKGRERWGSRNHQSPI